MTAWLMAVMFACTVPERDWSTVTEDDVRDALVKQDIKTVCLGLRSSDESFSSLPRNNSACLIPKRPHHVLKRDL